MDRIASLAFFIRIVEKQGVAAAGRDFGLSAAAASERLASLEAYYGATLLHRTTRSISLTDSGRLVLDRARSLVAEANDLEAQIKHGIDQLSGVIRLSVPVDLGESLIVPLVEEFMERHPSICVELTMSDGYVDIVGQGLDLAVRFGVLKDSSLIIKKLGDNKRVICASASYLKAHGTPRHPNDLKNHNCLVMQFGSIIDQQWHFQSDTEVFDITVSGNLSANSGAQVRRWCLAGKGIALKSIWDVREDLKAGNLVELLTEFAPSTRSSLQIIYPRTIFPVRRVRKFIEFLSDRIVD